MNLMQQFGSSSFWMKKRNDSLIAETMTDTEYENYNLYKLNANRKAIANFCTILTGKSIPVTFKTQGMSFTDGKQVVISANIEDPQNFDVACGLALHEASHIVLSDFEMLQNLKSLLELNYDLHDLQDKGAERGIHVLSIIKMLWNYVEDRRIDQYVFDRAPGYREYYRKMYDKYFNDALIEKGLKSKSDFVDESLESYKFRIINLHSKSTRVDALKGLPEIYAIVDLQNINRLKNSKETLEVAIEIFKVMLKHIPTIEEKEEQRKEQNQPSDGSSQEQTENSNSSSTDDASNDDNSPKSDDEDESAGSSESNDDESVESDGDDEEHSTGSDSTDNEDDVTLESSNDSKNSNKKSSEENIELSKRQQKLIKKKIESQEKFLDGEIEKRSVTESQLREVENIDETGSEIKTVATDSESTFTVNGVDVILVPNMTQRTVDSDYFPLKAHYSGTIESNKSAVQKGVQLGKILGKKIQVRSEQRETIYNRQLHGKIDKRMIASLGYGSQNVFYRSEVDMFNTMNLHISVDASSSMRGEKWTNSLINITAIAKACDIIPNLEIQISFRATKDENPYVVIAYDSRKDNFRKIINLFPKLNANGVTPEGLCFEATRDFLVESKNDLDSVFLNISDGQPWFNKSGCSYSGKGAAKHTYKEVRKMYERGIKVLSYFVSDRDDDGNFPTEDVSIFRESYGKATSIIDVTNMNEVSQTMNKVFMTK